MPGGMSAGWEAGPGGADLESEWETGKKSASAAGGALEMEGPSALEPGEVAEWEAVYWRMSYTNRRHTYALILRRYRTQMRAWWWDWQVQERIRAAQARRRRGWLDWAFIRATPFPLRLPLFHAALTFTCLSFLPPHPLSIPTALGVACALVFYIQVLAHRAGFRLGAGV